MNREQKQLLGDLLYSQAMILVEFFGEAGGTDELAAQGIQATEVREQIEKWFNKIPTRGI